MQRPPQLNEIPEGETRLSEVTKVVISNYTLYHLVATTLESLQDWVQKQKEIANGTERPRNGSNPN